MPSICIRSVTLGNTQRQLSEVHREPIQFLSFRSGCESYEKVVVDQNPRFAPPNAQKNPSAVPGDIPELNHDE
jgi:hypothetical protein